MSAFGTIGEFTLAQTAEIEEIISTPPVSGGGGVLSSGNEIILVEVSQYDLFGVEQNIRFSNVGYVGAISSVRTLFDPRLYTPIDLAINLNAENITTPIKSSTSISIIEFDLSGEDYFTNTIGRHWVGAEISIKIGDKTDAYDDFILVYTGRIEDFNYDLLNLKGQIKVVDFNIDFDSVLVEDLYDELALPPLRGRPKPYIRGTCYSIEPVLEDHVQQMYRISWGQNLNLIMDVRVGGVSWTETLTFPPGPGMWYGDLPGGVFYLGSETEGGEVRCDARATGWDTFTSAEFLALLALEKSITTDLAQFSIDAPELIGFYRALEPINIQEVLDIVISGIGGWWGFVGGNVLTAGVIKLADSSETVMSLSEVELNSFQLIRCLPPIYKLRIEYKRNWKPLTQAFASVLDEDLDDLKAEGIIGFVFDNSGILVYEPRAIDMQTVRSLTFDVDDSTSIRGRLISAYAYLSGTKFYELEYYGNDVPELYDTVYIEVESKEVGWFRVIGIVRSLPSANIKLKLWGFY